MKWHAQEKRYKSPLRAMRTAGMLAVLAGLLAGCLYPGGEQGQDRKVSYLESVERIQNAVDRFQADRTILPIITAGQETPRYEKFVIDLNLLQQQGFLDEIPATAFEKGGSAYFLLLNEEVDPTVKVMDLETVQKVNDVQRLVDQFARAHDGKLPALGEQETYPGLYTVDLELAGAGKYGLNSVYSGQPLNFIVDQAGRVYADYAPDIMLAVEKSGETPQDGEDLREVLTAASYFAPVKSLPYHWVDGSPVPQPES
ncbi:hypothetical protein V3851_00865 [Paenibacillus sp. M1]|uniref:DUF3939 domain-containing protein n=1 Tax=Paenibacillus haidiansis TaxID=1574488 RepID=A0ABU7VLP2_9BACL